jgi:hypothetical protein
VLRPIWVFAEERSGSSWLTEVLCTRLSRQYAYVELDREEIPDEEWARRVAGDPEAYSDPANVYQTHRFAILKSLANQPFVIRTTRRNRLEQVLSSLFLDRTRQTAPDFWRLPHVLGFQGPSEFLDVLGRTVGTYVDESEIAAYFAKKAARDELWRECSPRHDARTIFYEDLVEGVDIPQLDLRLCFSTPSVYQKLPYDKRTLFANYDQIARWVGAYDL